MRSFSLRRCALSLYAAAALAGCGESHLQGVGNASLLPVTTSNNRASTVSSDRDHKHKLFVSDNSASKIVIYQADVQNPSPIGTITAGVSNPFNLSVDQHGTLYVANGNGTITEYPKGQKTVSKTLTEPGGTNASAYALAVGNDGTVYAANLEGEVFEFTAGSVKVTRTLHGGGGYFVSLALDSKNDLFESWNDDLNCCDGVDEFKPARMHGKTILGNVDAGPVAVDSHDNLLVTESGHIAIYEAGSKTPFRKIHIRSSENLPRQLAFDSDERYLYFPSCERPSCGRGVVYGYNYKTGKLAWTVRKDLLGAGGAYGVALWPAAPQ